MRSFPMGRKGIWKGASPKTGGRHSKVCIGRLLKVCVGRRLPKMGLGFRWSLFADTTNRLSMTLLLSVPQSGSRGRSRETVYDKSGRRDSNSRQPAWKITFRKRSSETPGSAPKADQEHFFEMRAARTKALAKQNTKASVISKR